MEQEKPKGIKRLKKVQDVYEYYLSNTKPPEQRGRHSIVYPRYSYAPDRRVRANAIARELEKTIIASNIMIYKTELVFMSLLVAILTQKEQVEKLEDGTEWRSVESEYTTGTGAERYIYCYITHGEDVLRRTLDRVHALALVDAVDLDYFLEQVDYTVKFDKEQENNPDIFKKMKTGKRKKESPTEGDGRT